MKREIKFRAWNKDDNRPMFDPFTSGLRFETISNAPSVEIMQYTGLKDKNGVEIYEGDIIHKDEDGIVWSVEFDNTEGKFIVYNQLNSNRCFSLDYYHMYENCPIIKVWEEKVFYPEVIGNIHENPELIK